MNTRASDVYEVVIDESALPKRLLRTVFVFVTNLFTMGSGPMNPGGRTITAVNKQTGEELFRHVEMLGDDEGGLLEGINRDIATMSADEFAKVWTE